MISETRQILLSTWHMLMLLRLLSQMTVSQIILVNKLVSQNYDKMVFLLFWLVSFHDSIKLLLRIRIRLKSHVFDKQMRYKYWYLHKWELDSLNDNLEEYPVPNKYQGLEGKKTEHETPSGIKQHWNWLINRLWKYDRMFLISLY